LVTGQEDSEALLVARGIRFAEHFNDFWI
jgi:hypothetical protein